MKSDHSQILLYLQMVASSQAALHKLFTAFTSDKSIPLDERWTTFICAPASLKEHDMYTAHFDALPEDFVMYGGPCHAERCETISIAQLVELAIDYNEGGCENHPSQMEEMPVIDIAALKEEILKTNIGSFEYDW